MQNVFYLDVNPVIFHIGSLAIGLVGLMVALAVIFIVSWVLWQNTKYKTLSNDAILTAAVIAIPTAIIVSKLLHVIDLWSFYIQNPLKIFSGEGLTIWGAVLGATIGAWLYSHFSKQMRFAEFADIIAPGIIFAQAIGRVGCTFNGCCYGIQSNSPLACYLYPYQFLCSAGNRGTAPLRSLKSFMT
jgi:phosphatidylglycerol:prolipoprotein diacylglycerol transferase